MRVKFNTSVSSLVGSWGQGDVAEVRDDLAKQWIKAKMCEEAPKTKTDLL